MPMLLILAAETLGLLDNLFELGFKNIFVLDISAESLQKSKNKTWRKRKISHLY